MSHFSVLVITKTPGELEAALQPFHEFECTGVDDQYVKDIDDTAELREQYETDTTTRLRDPAGTLHHAYADRFYREPTAAEKKANPLAQRERTIPEGYVEVELPVKDLQTFAEWAAEYTGRDIVLGKSIPDGKGKYGYVRVDGDVVTCIHRTNPNKRWDWYQLGGRFSGLLRVKRGAAAVRGDAGVMGTRSDTGFDQCTARDLDYDAMAAFARRRSLGYIEEALTKTGLPRDVALARFREYVRVRPLVFAQWEATGKKTPFYEWWKIAEGPDADVFRETCEVGEALSGFVGAGVPDTEADPIAWANNRPALSVFAVLKDGKWHERGDMGWWGIVHDEKDRATWDAELANLLQGLPEDATISVIDCHI